MKRPRFILGRVLVLATKVRRLTRRVSELDTRLDAVEAGLLLADAAVHLILSGNDPGEEE